MDAYENFSDPKGLAIVFNNKNFRHMEEREGTDFNALGICKFLIESGYKVTLKQDHSANDMAVAMARFAQKPEHKDCHSAVVVVLSHGGYGKIYGTDCTDETDDINVQQLIGGLNANHCAGLRGKPKLFFRRCSPEIASYVRQRLFSHLSVKISRTSQQGREKDEPQNDLTIPHNITPVGFAAERAEVGTPTDYFQSQTTVVNPNQRVAVGMSEEQKEVLDSNLVPFCKELDVSVTLLAYMMQHKIFTEENEEEIRAERLSNARRRSFIKKLKQRGPDAFDTFYAALNETRQWHLAGLLKPHLSNPRSERLAKKTGPNTVITVNLRESRHRKEQENTRTLEKKKPQLETELRTELKPQTEEKTLAGETKEAENNRRKRTNKNKIRTKKQQLHGFIVPPPEDQPADSDEPKTYAQAAAQQPWIEVVKSKGVKKRQSVVIPTLQNLKKICQEESVREKNAKCIVVRGLPEDDLADDLSKVEKLLEACLGDTGQLPPKPVEVFRMGKDVADRPYPRLLKVVFARSADRAAVLRSSHHLKDHADYAQKVFIRASFSFMERLRIKTLYKKRNELNQQYGSAAFYVKRMGSSPDEWRVVEVDGGRKADHQHEAETVTLVSQPVNEDTPKAPTPTPRRLRSSIRK